MICLQEIQCWDRIYKVTDGTSKILLKLGM